MSPRWIPDLTFSASIGKLGPSFNGLEGGFIQITDNYNFFSKVRALRQRGKLLPCVVSARCRPPWPPFKGDKTGAFMPSFGFFRPCRVNGQIPPGVNQNRPNREKTLSETSATVIPGGRSFTNQVMGSKHLSCRGHPSQPSQRKSTSLEFLKTTEVF